MTPAWRTFFQSRTAAFLTVGLLTLQLGGCMAGLLSADKRVENFFFCLNPQGEWWLSYPALQYALLFFWLVLTFSWIVGLLALGVPRLRPIYWIMVMLIPAFMGLQQWLVQAGQHTCRFHI